MKVPTQAERSQECMHVGQNETLMPNKHVLEWGFFSLFLVTPQR